MKRVLGIFAMLLLVCALAAGEESTAVIRVNGSPVTAQELREAMRLHDIQAALQCASFGYAYDLTDRLNTLDAMDKVVFDLELRLIIREQAEAMGVAELTEASEEAARAEAEAEWQRSREIVNSDNGLAFLPAGDYEPAPEDEENITRYLASFGLTEEVLLREARTRQVEEQLQAAVTAEMGEADDEARLMYYVDWILARFDSAEIEEDMAGIEKACFWLDAEAVPAE